MQSTALVIDRRPKIHSLFISATAKDVKVYRKRVQQALQQATGLEVPLQEDLVEGAVNVVQLCQMWLHQSDAYIGIYGFRYGWIPDNNTDSITHLECKWAFSRWPANQQPCPLFLFLPEKDSDAEKFLKEAAETALKEDFPDSPDAQAKQEASKRRQVEFLSWVCSQGRFIQKYQDLTDLCVRAIASVNLWNGGPLEGAMKGRKQGGADEIPLWLLGAIDREAQLEALENILEAVGDRADIPGACVLVHGHDGRGQYEFLTFLADWLVDKWDGWKPEINVHEAIRRQPQPDAAALLRVAFAQLAQGRRMKP